MSGGLKPFRYSSEKGTIDEDGVYTAPSSPVSDVITVEDAYGTSVLSTIQVIEELTALPQSYAVSFGGDKTFFVSGGLSPYTAVSDRGTVQISGNTIDFTAQSSVSGNETDTIIVTDSLGSTATITVLVVDGSSLYIDPPSAAITVGDTVDLTANNGSSPTFSTISGTGVGTLNQTGNTATFTAIAAGIATVQVTSGLNTAQSIITVNSPDLLSLDPVAAAVKVGDTIQFTASGGVPDYTYKVATGGRDDRFSDGPLHRCKTGC